MRAYLKLALKLKPYFWRLTFSIFLSLVFAASNVIIMPLLKALFEVVANKNITNLNQYIIYAVIIYGVYLLTKYSNIYLMSKVGYNFGIDLRMALYEKLHTLSLDFYQKWKVGDILSRFFSDVDKVRESIMLNFQEILPKTLCVLGILGYLFYLNWKLTLISVIGIPLFTYMLSTFAEKLKRTSKQSQQKTADITHIVQEVLSSIQMIKAFTTEKYEINRFHKENIRGFTATMKSIKVQSTLEPFIGYLQFLIFALIVWYSGYEVVQGNMKGIDLIPFYTGVFLLIDPILALSRVYTVTQQSLGAVIRISQLLDSAPTVVNDKNAIKVKKVNGEILFKNVCFSYEEERGPVLKNINLDVKEGEIIALVGLSGAGKSTLVNLIPRFYDPTQGQILLDGLDLKKIDLESLRKYIGIVSQETILFRGTILENIRYGNILASEDDVREAAVKANAWEFIEKMPDKLLTKVGDRGQKLSGGQKQRISIARAILRNPKILILDEATSALDSESEKLIQDALITLMKGKTTFVIAHRLSTIMHANRIVVLENGEIKEIGSHLELLKNAEGIYSKLYQLQFNYYA